ncbi:L,D-transpeptidase [Thioalkalicoccus limnaeus]|uniref:L,D-transpeptidase n=1 Tax=Thioalkalicoccus limnaeus TaxID=120681 RepID=A0ABV4BBI3_9GAMM
MFVALALLGGCAKPSLGPERAMPVTAPVAAPVAPVEDPRLQAPPAKERSLTILLDTQQFEYREDGRLFARGEVSAGKAEHPTPRGQFRVLSKDRYKRSGSYTNYFNKPTPMPYSLQFYGPYYVHEGWLPGHPASRGCVRLHYEDARLLFERMRVGDRIVIR